MGPQGHTNAKLPKHLLEELGVEGDLKLRSSSRKCRPGLRKERRKAARLQTGSRKLPTTNRLPKDYNRKPTTEDFSVAPINVEPPNQVSPVKKPSKSILKANRSPNNLQVKDAVRSPRSFLTSPGSRPSKSVRDRLAADDAEIAALEKALGVKGSKKLPAAFEQDGLDLLLGGLDNESETEISVLGKRSRAQEDEWLRSKRLKAQDLKSTAANPLNESSSRDSPLSVDEDVVDGSEIKDSLSQTFEDTHSFEDFSDTSPSQVPPEKNQRENPYVAPPVPSNDVSTNKYVPPSLRADVPPNSEGLVRLRRRIQGLLNRLSEANLLAIVKEIETLYQNNPRQDVSSTLVDLLLDLLADSSSLNDTFIILHAGFIAALFKTVGSDLGALAVSRIYDVFDELYQTRTGAAASGKKLANLVSSLAQLYNFRVISSNLICALIRMFIENLSEIDTELLLKVTRSSGPQLRKEDPGSLKRINQLLQSAIVNGGAANLSVRTKFMVETISSLSSRGAKANVSESVVTAEHIVRMRQILGSLNERNGKASEPLGVGLNDLKNADRRGKWWLVGASFRDERQRTASGDAEINRHEEEAALATDPVGSLDADLAQIARHLGMNTDVRRSILTNILTADDYEAAYQQLRKIPLSSNQRSEIPRVLMRCSAAQEPYNPFFTLLARRLISAEPKLGKAFQFALWSLFDKMREATTNDQDGKDDGDLGQIELRGIINIARMFGTLIAQDGLSLKLLKDLNFAFLEGRIRYFAELLMSTVILQSQDGVEGHRNEERTMAIFLRLKEMPDTARGLQYFLKKVVSKTDIAGSKEEMETVRWGCQVARDALKAIAASDIAMH